MLTGIPISPALAGAPAVPRRKPGSRMRGQGWTPASAGERFDKMAAVPIPNTASWPNPNSPRGVEGFILKA